ncbi:MAG: hypothetical protein SW019_21725 [Actinomycetota bacterium]|nr:hypothetical protein [Actinomycetota bacterium]
MSRRSDQKKARRKKRRATRDRNWLPDDVQDRVAEIVSDLEDFDARLTERGWQFNDDPDDPDDEIGVTWLWPPSYTELDDPDAGVAATVIALIEEEGGEIAHVVFVGTADDYQFGLDELFEYLDVIEAYRLGDPPPVFAT